MPVVLRHLGFVFFFYSNEGNEPSHIHVRKSGGYAKFWLEPIELEYSEGLKVNELAQAESIIKANIVQIKEKWDEIHGK